MSEKSVAAASHINILLLEKVSTSAVELFKQQGFNVKTAVKYTEDELVEVIKDVHVIGVRSKTRINKRVLDAAKRLMSVGCFCIGTDQTDLDLCTQRGIPVFNAPYANTRSVSELALAEIIMLARQATDRSMEVHKGTWNKNSDGCYEVRNKTLGVIGYGHVGSQLSVLAEALGMKVVFYDIIPKLAMGTARQMDTLDHLLESSDFVSLHVPATASTENMIGAAQLDKMKKGSYFLNLARGTCVDIEAVAARLRSGHLAGAAFDVYPSEPAGQVDDWKVCLQGCPNTILTPHIGGSTEEAQVAIGKEVAMKIIDFINRGSTVGAVNVPEVTISKWLPTGHSRVISFHKNTPGVLRDINAVISVANISSQLLETGFGIGCMIVDLESEMTDDVLAQLEKMDANIRCRILYPGLGYVGPELK